uniref:FHA domain-containing protein n=1 Tax=Glossina pallidipes TaxID=7398 RepID=A0A1A9Z8H1_GLOPL
MSLESAKLIRLDEAGNQCETIVASGRKLTLGYYMSCDYVLTDPRAKGVHCEIECDALGRVFIHNFCEEYPVHLNGFPISIKRTLLSGSKILILDTLFEWEFQPCVNIVNEDISMQKTTSTPERQIGVPEQSANSCPDLKPHREVTKRLTIHNFVHCIQSCGEGNAEADPFETRNVSDQGQNERDQQEGQEVEESSKENENREKFDNESCTQHLLQVPLTFAEENPRMDIIMCTENKANKNTQENKRLLAMCSQSDVLITSYSPRQTGVRIQKSFTSLYTSRSGCGTPKSVNDLIDFCTPSTSKNATLMNPVAASNQNTTMHLVDLTATPKETSSYLKAAASKKYLIQKSSKDKLASSDITGVPVSHFTPLSNDSQKDSSATLDSVASVITVSSTDNSSIVEATPGVSFPRLSKKTTSKRTHEVDHLYTPKRTTQPLIRRVLQSSAKNQAYKARNNIDYVTPTRNVQGNAVYVVNPKSVEPERSCNAKLIARSCLSTPSRKNVIKSDHDLDNCIASTSQGARKSIFNPLSGTSTPLIATKNCSMTREGMPSHKARNFIKVTQRSQLTNNNFTAKFSSNKKKSPQTYLSKRLVLRARKSLNNKSPTTRSRKLCTVVKEKSTSERTLPDVFEKTLLINNTEKNVNNSSDELSRTFIIDSNKNADGMHNMKLNKDDPQARNSFEKIKNSHAIIEGEDGANISMGMEDASKLLLQEIEIVLNKSDEFQQKHLESKSTNVEKAPSAVANKELEENEPISLTKLVSKKSLTSIDNQELRETTSVISLLDNNQGQASFAGKCKTELLPSTRLRVCEQKEKSEIVPFSMERYMENTSDSCMEIIFSMSPAIAKEKPKKIEIEKIENTSKISEIQSFPVPCVAETGILSPLSTHLNEKADKTQLIASTSRCSVICPSLSLKNSVGLTSDTQRNRRASCTAINELFPTPRINTRRLSISVEDEKTVANSQMSRADTAQDFFNVEHLNIPLEMSEDMGAVVGENENVQTEHSAEEEKSHIIKDSSAVIAETICTSEEVICDVLDETVKNFTRDAKANINRVNVKDMGEQQSAVDLSQFSGEPKHVAEEILTKNSEVLDNSDYGYGNELDESFNAETGSLIHLNNKSEIEICTPISSVTEWKSLIAQIPTQKSLFSASEILSDLSRSNVKELAEPAKKAETLSKMLKHGSQVDPNEDLSTKDTTPGVTCSYTSLYLPLTKSVMNVTNTSDVMLDISSTSQSNITDPLAGTSIVDFANKHECSSASLDFKGDVSGIRLLDKTTESMSDEQAMDSERDEQVSTFSLQIIDCDKVNQLSEPLIVTDSEDFSMLHESSPNRTGCQLLDKRDLTKQSMEEMGVLEDPERGKKRVDCVSISSVFIEEEVSCKKELIVESRKCSSEEKELKTVNAAAVFEGTLAKDDSKISEETPVPKNVTVEMIAGQIEIETGFCVKTKGRGKTNADFLENASLKVESPNSAKVDAELLEETHCAQLLEEFETTKCVAFPVVSKLLQLEEKEKIAVLETDPIISPKTISVNVLQASHNQLSYEKEKHPNHSAFPEVSPTSNETFLEPSQSKVEESIFLKRYSKAKPDCTKNHERGNSIFTLSGATCVTNTGKTEEEVQQGLVLSTSVRKGIIEAKEIEIENILNNKDDEYQELLVGQQKFGTLGEGAEGDASKEMISMKKSNERGQKGEEHLENSSTALIATQQAAYETMEETGPAVSQHVNTMTGGRIFESEFAKKFASGEFEQEVSSTAQLVSKTCKISEKDEKSFIDAKEVEPLKRGTSFDSASDNKVFLKEEESFAEAEKDISKKLDEDFLAISLPKAEISISDIADKEVSTVELPGEVRCDTVLEKITTIENVDFLEDSKTLNELQICKTAVIEIDPITSVKHVSTNEVKIFDKEICPVKCELYAKVLALPTAISSHIETLIDLKDPQVKLQESLLQRNSKASSEDTEKQESNGDISVGIKPLDVILSASIGDGSIEANKVETANVSQVQDEEFEELFVDEQQFESLDEAAEETVSAEMLLTKRTAERIQKMGEYLDNAGMSAEVIENKGVDRSSHITNIKEQFIVKGKFTEERESETEIAQVFVTTEKSEIASKQEEEFIVRNLNVPGIQPEEVLLTDVECRGGNMDESVSDNAADIVEVSSMEGAELSNSQELVTIEIFSSEKNAAGNLTKIIEIAEAAKESGSKILNSSTPPFNKIEENKTGENLKCEIITIQKFKKSGQKKPEIEDITKLNVINQSESVDHEKTDSEKQTKADKLFIYKEYTSVTDNELKSSICEVVVIDSDFETKSSSSIKQIEENHNKDEAKARKGSQFSECSDANPDLVSTKRAICRIASAPQEQLHMQSENEQENSKLLSSDKRVHRKFTTSESNEGCTFDNNDGTLATTHKTREEPITEQAETKELSFSKLVKDKTLDIKDIEHALVKELPTITTVKNMSVVEGEHEPFAISEPKWNKKCSDHTEQLSFNIAHMAGASAKEPAILHNQTPVKDIQFVSTDPTMVKLRSAAIHQASKYQPTHPSPSTLDIEITYHEMKEVQKTPRKRELKRRNVADSSHSSITNVDDPPTRARKYNRDFQKEDNITIASEVVNESRSDEKEFTQQQNQNVNLKKELFATPKKNADEEVKAVIVSEKADQIEVKTNENLDTSSTRPLRRRAARRVLNEKTTIEGNQKSKRRKPLESKLREVVNVSSKSTTGIATETESSEIVDTDLQKDTTVIEHQSHSRTAKARQKPSEKQESNFSISTTTKRRTRKRKAEEKQQLLKDTVRQIKPTTELEIPGTTSIAIDRLEITSRSNDLKVSDEQATFQSGAIPQTVVEANNKQVCEHEESQYADDEIELLTLKTKKLKNLETSKLRLVEIDAIEESSAETAQKTGLLRDSQIEPSQYIDTSRKALGSPGVNRAKLVSETESIQSSTDRTKISVTKRPQRKAATAYHNYDETSDTEMQTVTKEKHDTSQKLLAEKMAEVVAEHNQAVTRTEMAIGVVTTTRGRMRKPTAKVQQFLEKERAKAESPKKRNVRSTGTPAEQRKPGRRGRKPSANEMGNAESDTPKTSKRSRGRAVGEFSATTTSAERPIQETPATVADVQSERSVESVITTKYITKSNNSPTETSTLSAVKSRRRGRANVGVEQFETEEFARKKVSSTFEYERQKGSTPTSIVEAHKPKRNAAAAAKARIEEDALAAAAIDPPKKSRAKRIAPRTPTADVRDFNTEVDEDKCRSARSTTKEKRQILAATTRKRDHRLASASTVGSTDEFADIEGKIGEESTAYANFESEAEKPATKREARNKTAALVNNAPVVPVKRTRKGKSSSDDAGLQGEPGAETKGTTRTARARKIVHFEHATEIAGLLGEITKTPGKETSAKQPPQRLSFTMDNETGNAASRSQQSSLTLPAEALLPKRTIRTRRK